MSLYSALRSGVSGLFAQTQAMSMIADNITNVNTTGYKAVRTRFSSLVGSASQGSFAAGVVSAVAERSVSSAGQVTTSNSNTHIAVNGKGFFAVTKADDVYLDRSTGDWKSRGEVLYTRAGDFSADANGNLRNSAGYVLLGWSRNTTNTGYNVSNLVTDFTAVNVAGTVGQPLPTQNITMNANLNASAKVGDTFTMTAPMYSRQGGISNVEYRFVKVGEGISERKFKIQARVTSGSAQMANEGASGRDAAGSASGLKLWGAQLGSNSREVVLNYSDKVVVDPTKAKNIRVEYMVGKTLTTLEGVTATASGGKVTVTLRGDIPTNGTNIRMYIDGTTADIPFSAEPARGATVGTPLTQPPIGTPSTAGNAPTPGTAFNSPLYISGYYDVGEIAFDASGLNPTITPINQAEAVTDHPFSSATDKGSAWQRNEANGYFSAGKINDGELSMLIDHSADGKSASFSGSDDVRIVMNFSKSGASAGMTSYESPSTIYSIDQDGNGSGDLQTTKFNARGELQAVFSKGSPKFLAQVPLVNFNNPNALLATDGNAYKASDEAGVGVSRVAGTGDSGTIAGSSLEKSNADIATEFTEMIVVQRAYSAATKIITTSDEMLDEVIRSKR